MLDKGLAQLRREYSSMDLSKRTVAPDPMEQFAKWMNDALNSEIIDANAMTLSTADISGTPSARVVLLKGYSPRGFVFFTNYLSRKGRELSVNPRCVLSFFWPELERQLIIGGIAEKSAAEESESYFATRPVASRLGAWASDQSTVIGSRTELENRLDAIRAKFGDSEVPRPQHWGGFCVVPNEFEFWQGRENRLHDRIYYTRSDAGWKISRLAP